MLMYIIVFLLVGVLVTFDIMANLPGHRAISGVSVLVAIGLCSWYFYTHQALIEDFKSGKRVLCIQENGKIVISKGSGYEYQGGYFIDVKGEAIDEDYCQSLE